MKQGVFFADVRRWSYVVVPLVLLRPRLFSFLARAVDETRVLIEDPSYRSVKETERKFQNAGVRWDAKNKSDPPSTQTP